MAGGAGGSPNISFTRGRRLILAVGLGVLLVISGVTYARGVDPDEVRATLLFVPIFVAFIFWGMRGGLVAGVLATVGYLGLRYNDIQLVGFDRFLSLIFSRSAAFLAFGLLGGWASRQIDASLTKLEIYDQIDDDTGLYNARFFVQDTDLEVTRSKRYRTIFSVALVDIPESALEPLSRRQRQAVLKELGRILKDSVRTVDRALHARAGGFHRLGVVLPETGREGTRVFTERFEESVLAYLVRRGLRVAKNNLRSVSATFPEDETVIQRLQNEFRQIDRTEHPETQSPPEARPDTQRSGG
ncbi:MAG: GGDEF domain-containing protein [Acidimicrobiia bacterium]